MEAVAAICVQNLQENHDFYVQQLGWKLLQTTANGHFLENDGEVILLTDIADNVQEKLVEPKIVWRSGAMILLQESGIEAKFADLKERNVAGIVLKDYFWGDRELRISAPEKIEIVILEATERQPEEWLNLYLKALDYLDEALSAHRLEDEIEGLTIRQHVHRMVADDLQWTFPLSKALVESEGNYQHSYISLDDWAKNPVFQTTAIEPALALMRAIRHYIVALIENTDDPWERYVRNEEIEDSQRHPVIAFIRIQALRALYLVDKLKKQKS